MPPVTPNAAAPLASSLPAQDDMTLAPDLFSYFEATAPVLDADPTLYCVSSWNDHGQVRLCVQ